MRDDLAALTPEKLAALANWGLVKRATRDIEAGRGPVVEEEEATVTGCFPDGVEVRLPPGTALRDAFCSCGAGSVCRHRVAVVLAYASGAGAPRAASSEITDDQLLAHLGRRLFERAQRSWRAGLVAEVEGDQVRLPTCTVQFLVPGDLNYARCTCELSPCEHLALAVWATRSGAMIEIRPVKAPRPVSRVTRETLEALFREGLVSTDPGFPRRFARSRRELAGMTWPLALLDRLQQCRSAYHEGSALYRAGEAAFALVSLLARLRAQGELSAAFLLGTDTPAETALDHTTLLGLGARRTPSGLRAFFADPEGQVLVLEGDRPAPGLHLADLCRGRLVSRGVVRRANRSLRLKRDRSAHSLMRHHAGWDDLPEALRREPASRPPRLLRPLVLAENLRAFKVEEVHEMVYCPGDQELLAHVELDDGTSALVRRAFESTCPHALDALARELPSCHWLTALCDGAELEPVALVGEAGMTVLDLATEPFEWDLDDVAASPRADALDSLLTRAWDLAAQALHHGASHPPSGFASRRVELATELESCGLSTLAPLARSEWDLEGWYRFALRVELARGG